MGAFAVMDSSPQLILQSHMTRTAHAVGSPGPCLRINRRAQNVSPVGAFAVMDSSHQLIQRSQPCHPHGSRRGLAICSTETIINRRAQDVSPVGLLRACAHLMLSDVGK